MATKFARDARPEEANHVAQGVESFRILIRVIGRAVAVLDVGRHRTFDRGRRRGVREGSAPGGEQAFAVRTREAVGEARRRDARQLERLEGTRGVGLHRHGDLTDGRAQAIGREVRIGLAHGEAREVLVVLRVADVEEVRDRVALAGVDVAVQLRVVGPALRHRGLRGVKSRLVAVEKPDELEGFVLQGFESFFDVRNASAGRALGDDRRNAGRKHLPVGRAQKVEVDREVFRDEALVLRSDRENTFGSGGGDREIRVGIDGGHHVARDVGDRIARVDARLHEVVTDVEVDRAGFRSGAREGDRLRGGYARFGIGERQTVERPARILIAVSLDHAVQKRAVTEKLGGLLGRRDVRHFRGGGRPGREHRTDQKRLHRIGRRVGRRVVDFRVKERRVDLLRDRVERDSHLLPP